MMAIIFLVLVLLVVDAVYLFTVTFSTLDA